MTSLLGTNVSEALTRVASKCAMIGQHFQELSDMLSSLGAMACSSAPLLSPDVAVDSSMQTMINAVQAIECQVVEATAVAMSSSQVQVDEEKENRVELASTTQTKTSKKARKKAIPKPLIELTDLSAESVTETRSMVSTAVASTVDEPVAVMHVSPLSPPSSLPLPLPLSQSQPQLLLQPQPSSQPASPPLPSQPQQPQLMPQHPVPDPSSSGSTSTLTSNKKKVVNVFHHYCNEFRAVVKAENPLLSKADVHKKLVEQWKQYPDKVAYTKSVMEGHQEPAMENTAEELVKPQTKKKTSRVRSNPDVIPSSEPSESTKSHVAPMQVLPIESSLIASSTAQTEMVQSVTMNGPVGPVITESDSSIALPMPSLSVSSASSASSASLSLSTVSPALVESSLCSNNAIVAVTLAVAETEKPSKKTTSKKRKKSHEVSVKTSEVVDTTLPSLTGPALVHPHPVAKTLNKSISYPNSHPHPHPQPQPQPHPHPQPQPHPHPHSHSHSHSYSQSNSKTLITPPATAAPSPAPKKIMTPAMREIQEEAALSSLEKEKKLKKKHDQTVYSMDTSKH